MRLICSVPYLTWKGRLLTFRKCAWSVWALSTGCFSVRPLTPWLTRLLKPKEAIMAKESRNFPSLFVPDIQEICWDSSKTAAIWSTLPTCDSWLSPPWKNLLLNRTAWICCCNLQGSKPGRLGKTLRILGRFIIILNQKHQTTRGIKVSGGDWLVFAEIGLGKTQAWMADLM